MIICRDATLEQNIEWEILFDQASESFEVAMPGKSKAEVKEHFLPRYQSRLNKNNYFNLLYYENGQQIGMTIARVQDTTWHIMASIIGNDKSNSKAWLFSDEAILATNKALLAKGITSVEVYFPPDNNVYDTWGQNNSQYHTDIQIEQINDPEHSLNGYYKMNYDLIE
jgi:hypothetical protein